MNWRIVFTVAALAASILPATAGEPASREVGRFKADEAHQGVAVDGAHFYAVTNSEIGKYSKTTGKKVGMWKGDPALTKHINSCNIIEAKLICANSNYPDVPMTSSVEVFDPATMTHVESIPLGPGIGSLTWLVRKDGFWWATFANYDGRGGEAGRDHRFTTFVKFDDAWQRRGAWLFPANVQERFRPMSSSGGVWGDDDLLYITGHDHTELYVLRLPKMGAVLEYVTTVPVNFAGQAIAWDPSEKRMLYAINRATREVVAIKLAPVQSPAP
jgi:hypothetical protein